MKHAQGQFDDFAEETLDYARCQRPDGSYYGTGGVCRKGSSVGAKEKEASSGGKSGGADTKQTRKDMIAARDKEKSLREARKKAEAGDDKKAAAEARKAHIESKKEAKAAVEAHQNAQRQSGDDRRFGREAERMKASNEELTAALQRGKMSPTAKAAVEREVSTRLARAKDDVNKRLKTVKDEREKSRLRAQRSRIEEAQTKLRYAKKGLGGAQSRLTGAQVNAAVGTTD